MHVHVSGFPALILLFLANSEGKSFVSIYVYIMYVVSFSSSGIPLTEAFSTAHLSFNYLSCDLVYKTIIQYLWLPFHTADVIEYHNIILLQ